MSETDEHLGRWQAAGIIDGETASRIRAFEAAPARTSGSIWADRPGPLEALLYLGVAVAAVGAFSLAAQNWGELQSWARATAVGVPALMALLAGAVMLRSEDRGIQRAGQASWLVCVALFGGTVAVVLNEYGSFGDGDERAALLVVAVSATMLAVALWAFSPNYPQVVAIGGALFLLAQSLGNWPDEFSVQLAGIVLLLFGIVGIGLTEARIFEPREGGRALFGMFAAFGPYQAGLDGTVAWAEALVFLIGAGLIALSVARATFVYMVVGVGIIFVGLVTFVFEHFSDDLGAPVALMLSGGLVVAGVLILSQLRGAMRQRRPA